MRNGLVGLFLLGLSAVSFVQTNDPNLSLIDDTAGVTITQDGTTIDGMASATTSSNLADGVAGVTVGYDDDYDDDDDDRWEHFWESLFEDDDHDEDEHEWEDD